MLPERLCIGELTHSEKVRERDKEGGMDLGVVLSADKGGRMPLSIVNVIGWRVLFGAGGKTFRAPLMRRLTCTLWKTSELEAWSVW